MGVRRVIRSVRRRLHFPRPRPAILMYHRVAPLRQDPWALAVSPDHFEQQIQYLRQHRLPMFVDEMVELAQSNKLPAKAVAVTFDDAYRDNLVHARPVLERYGVPATVFVPTGYVGKTQPFWWDELAGMILDCAEATDAFQVCDGVEVPLRWGPRERADADTKWRGWDPPQSARQTAYVALWSAMQKTSVEERFRVMETLRTVFPVAADPLSLPMNAAELASMVEGDLVRLGAHSVHHVSLSDVSLEEGTQEIRLSQQQCQSLSAVPVRGFAYPYGNLTPEICREIAAAGLAWACAAEGGCLNQRNMDRFRLPRVAAADVAGRAFSQSLRA